MMLYNERVQTILGQLQVRSTVKVNELSQLMDVSVDTIRRDLKSMERDGLVTCVRGGACLRGSVLSVADFTGREIINSGLKREAAGRAIECISQGDLIALNSGTTNTVLAQELAGAGVKCTVVTNNFAAREVLMGSPSVQVIAIGGDVDAQERSSWGSACEAQFGRFRPDKVFLSINAVSLEDGFTDFRFRELGVIELLARTGKRVIAVMDSSKFGTCSKSKVLDLDQVDILVTDSRAGAETLEAYRDRGLEVLRAGG